VLGFYLKKIFDPNKKEIKKLSKVVLAINELEDKVSALSMEELRKKTDEFKDRYNKGESLDDLLPEAFAVVREVAKRTIGLRPFDVQLMGGIVLHQGRIAEMKTGEGKTLVATLPAYLNALTGKGVHIVTVNDYLARRDAEWMGPIYRELGLTVGVIQHNFEPPERKEIYRQDIVYVTNNEIGFDYLRDNMVIDLEQQVLRELNYAIVDEVDSILIDEARTPLIISGRGTRSSSLYYKFAKIAQQLEKGKHYTVDEKAHAVPLTEEGIAKVEALLGIDNFYDNENIEAAHQLQQALRAKELFRLDVDYVIKDRQVIIVDEFTGRLMFGRRYSDGLHQAIEAKEGVRVQEENQTLATITFQNFFRLYKKLAGMTGTAATEEEEFRKIYGMDVVVIPTNKLMIRKDMPDIIYKTEEAKFNAILEKIEELHKKGQPVLVGTRSVEVSERLSEKLRKRKIPHNVLNAKYHEREAEIIAQAGRLGAVTISTNMAGRGTDIILGGDPVRLAKEEHSRNPDEPFEPILEKWKKICAEEQKKVIECGGLHILGTERHEARRIDNQLRGRAGRQGDPGSSQFYISLEDELMKIFGSNRLKDYMDKLGMDDNIPIENRFITTQIEAAQKRVESHHFSIRRQVMEYDEVMNRQRTVIYGERKKVLEGANLKENILNMLKKTIEDRVTLYANSQIEEESWDLEALIKSIKQIFPLPNIVLPSDLVGMKSDEIVDYFYKIGEKVYSKREEEFGEDVMRKLERLILLQMIDTKWIDHLYAMDNLRDGIGLRAYGQRDPRVEYEIEAYDLFQELLKNIQEDTIQTLFRIMPAKGLETRKYRSFMVISGTNRDGDASPTTMRREGKKLGRNDPCPCGSGKKYKKCCMRKKSLVR